MLRLLLRYLANNEELVRRLSESYPVQTAARIVVSVFHRSKGIVDDHDLKRKLDPNQVREIISKFTRDVKKEVEDIKRKKGM